MLFAFSKTSAIRTEKNLLQLAIGGSLVVHTIIFALCFWQKNLPLPQASVPKPQKNQSVLVLNVAEKKPQTITSIAPSTQEETPQPEAQLESNFSQNAASNTNAQRDASSLPALTGQHSQTLDLNTQQPAFGEQNSTQEPSSTTPTSSTAAPTSTAQQSTASAESAIHTARDTNIQLPEINRTETTQNLPEENTSLATTSQPEQQNIQQIAVELKGQLDTQGNAAFQTKATALGQYLNQAGTQIAATWQQETANTPTRPGLLRLRFRIRADGEISDLKWTYQRASGTAQNIVSESVLATELPPMPQAVLDELAGKPLWGELDFLFL